MHPTPAHRLAIAALICFGLGLINMLTLCLLRIGLETDFWMVANITMVGGAICFSPLLLPAQLQALQFACGLAVAAALLMVSLSILSPALAFFVYALLFLWGAAKLVPALKQGPAYSWKSLCLLAIAWGLYCFLQSHAERYAGVFSHEYTLLGIQHRDTMMHASITNMIWHYSKVTFGEGSLDTINYHVGLHVWLGACASMLHAHVVDSLPFILRGIIFPAFALAAFLAVPTRLKSMASDPRIVIATLLYMIALTDMTGEPVQWLSESYVFSLIFLFLGLSALSGFIPLYEKAPQYPVAAPIAFCLLMAVALVSKISVGLLGLAFGGYLSFRYRKFAWQTWLLGFSCFGAGLYMHYLSLAHAQRFYPLHYILAFAGTSECLTALLPLACLLLASLKLGPAFAVPRPLLEALALLSCGAAAIPNLIEILDGSGIYFIDVARWIGLWALLVWLCQSPALEHISQALASRAYDPAAQGLYSQVAKWFRAHPSRLLLFLPFLVIFITDCAYFKTYSIDEAKQAAKEELAWNPNAASYLQQHQHAGGLLGPQVYAVTQEGYGAHLLAQTAQAILPSDKMGATAIYIPRDNFYWSWPETCRGWKHGYYARIQGLFFQAMTSIPILNTVPYDKEGCYHLFEQMNFELQKLDPPADENDAWLCSLAKTHHFDTVLVLSGDRLDTRFKRLTCAMRQP